jgi:YHS domain-containing protein
MIICDVCGGRIQKKSHDRKYMFHPPYFCSEKCLLQFILNHEPKGSLEGVCLLRGNLSVGSIWSKRHGISFRSLFEYNVANYLSDNSITFEYEGYTFEVGKGSYTPDFYLPDHDLFIEVKGLWAFGAKKKLKKFTLLYPSIEIVVLHWNMHGMFFNEETNLTNIGL